MALVARHNSNSSPHQASRECPSQTICGRGCICSGPQQERKRLAHWQPSVWVAFTLVCLDALAVVLQRRKRLILEVISMYCFYVNQFLSPINIQIARLKHGSLKITRLACHHQHATSIFITFSDIMHSLMNLLCGCEQSLDFLKGSALLHFGSHIVFCLW